MAKLSKVKSKRPIYIGVDGIYIQNLPTKALQGLLSVVSGGLQDDPAKAIVALFADLICDETGVAFEDVGSYEAILEVLSVKDIQDIMNAVSETMNPSAKDLGK